MRNGDVLKFCTVVLVALIVTSLVFYTRAQGGAQPVQVYVPKQTQSLNGQIWMQVIGDPSANIPILREEGVTGVQILLGAYDTANPSQWLVDEVEAYRSAGFLVSLEWNFMGGWGRLYDMNPTVAEYAHNNPAQAWAAFVWTTINTSSLPASTQVLANGSMVVPLVTGKQAYVYEYYSPQNYTWAYNETGLSNPWGNELGTPLRWGADYRVFVNSTGTYALFNTRLSTSPPYIVYNLHWINFLYDNYGSYSGLPGWPSLFYNSSFSVWENSWIQGVKVWAGKIDQFGQDNSGFPSLDANPGIIQYLEDKYNFAFTFYNWSYSQSRSLWEYENYILMDSFQEMRQTIAHQYGITLDGDTSDQNAGLSFMAQHYDEIDAWEGPGYQPWFDSGVNYYGSIANFAGNFTNITLGLTDFESSPPPTSDVVDYINQTMVVVEMTRPEAASLIFDWEFQTNLTPQADIEALHNWTRVWREAFTYGGFLSSIGAKPYTLGTVYVSDGLPFATMPAPMSLAPAQVNFFNYGSAAAWAHPAGVYSYPPSDYSDYPYNTGLPPEIALIFNAWNTCNFDTRQPCWAVDGPVGLVYWASYLNKSSQFYVLNNLQTYVFEYGQLYYVFENPMYDAWFAGYTHWYEPATFNFTYYNLPNYVAYDVATGGIAANNTLLPSGGPRGSLIVLVPQNTSATQLLWTNASVFYQNTSNDIVLANQYPQETSLVLASPISIAEFAVSYSNGTTTYISTNSSVVSAASSGGIKFYKVNLGECVSATVWAYAGTNTQTTSSTTSTSTSTTTPTTTTSTAQTTQTSTQTTSTTSQTATTPTQTTTTTQTPIPTQTATQTPTQTTTTSATETATPTQTSSPTQSATTTQTAPTTTPTATTSTAGPTATTTQTTSGGATSPTTSSHTGAHTDTSNTGPATRHGGNSGRSEGSGGRFASGATPTALFSNELVFRGQEFVVGAILLLMVVAMGVYVVRSRR